MFLGMTESTHNFLPMQAARLLVMSACLWFAGGMPVPAQEEDAASPPAVPSMPFDDAIGSATMKIKGILNESNIAETLAEFPSDETQPKTRNDVAVVGGGEITPGEDMPLVRPELPKVMLIVKQMGIDLITSRIHEQTGVTVKAIGNTKTVKMDLVARDVDIETALEQITVPNNWKWVRFQDGHYEIMDQQAFTERITANQVKRVGFRLRHIDATELEKVVTPILTPDVGAAAVDVRTNTLIVTDLPDKLALIESIVAEYDIALTTRVFNIVDADTEEIAERFENVMSESAVIEVDPLNHIIIIRDTFEKIRIMEQLVEIFDRDRELRVYNLNNVGLEGDVALAIVETFLEPLVTEDALLEYNEDLNKLLLRDVQSVHTKIEEILLALDEPRKQVLVEGEVLSVELNESFSLGSDWIYSLGQPIPRDNLGLESVSLSRALPAGVTQPTDPIEDGGVGGASGGSATNGSGFKLFTHTDRVIYQLEAALSDNRTRLLARPRILIANNELGRFEVARNEPIRQTFFNSGNNSNNNFRSSGQSTIPTGLIIELTPFISNRGLIEMEVQLENSVPLIVDDIGDGNRGVGSTEETAETYLIIPDGETRLIGGLITQDSSESVTGIPFLTRIPLLGYLFGKKTTEETNRNLLFFLTPTIIVEESKNDLLVEPVNLVAKRTMMESDMVAVRPDDLNEIPEQLIPYLEEVRSGDSWHTGGGADSDSTATLQLDIPTTTTEGLDADSADLGASLLKDFRFSDPGQVESAMKIGGATTYVKSQAGPSGTFGGGNGKSGTRSRVTASGKSGGDKPKVRSRARTSTRREVTTQARQGAERFKGRDWKKQPYASKEEYEAMMAQQEAAGSGGTAPGTPPPTQTETRQ
jgi:type II secretory pathway component GspD/PulD (secretin)